MTLNPIKWYRKRKRLELVRRNLHSPRKYYRDPLEGTIYLGEHRYDPFLMESFYNHTEIDP